jgi:hypothetical protein
MKKRVTIYIDEDLWVEVKHRAWELKKSASGYLSDLFIYDLLISGESGGEGVETGRTL